MMAADNVTDLAGSPLPEEEEEERMALFSIVVSTTMLFLAILFGGGGCVTVLIAMCVHKLLRKLRYILLGILLFISCVFDFVWCPIEITRMVLYHRSYNSNSVSNTTIGDLKHIGSGLYILLLSALAAIIVLISVQNILKLLHKYDSIPKIKFGVITILVWLLLCTSLTVVYVIIAVGDEDREEYHSFNNPPFYFKMGVQMMWVVLLLMPAVLMVVLQTHSRLWRGQLVSETSDLHSTDNFTVPSLIIKSVEEMEEEDDEVSEALPSPDIHKDSGGGSPVSKGSKSALKKRSGSPSSQKVLFADMPSPSRESPAPSFGERFKSPNHLGVNMAAILGRRRHTIAQITDPHLDLMQKAKSYNYVRKFSVDISALQAQLENPKLHANFQFHSQQELKGSKRNESDQQIQDIQRSNDTISRRSRDEMMKSQDIAEEPENDSDNDMERKPSDEEEANVEETQSMISQSQSVRSTRSARDSMCPTPPLISLTQSDGEEKQLEPNNTDTTDDQFPAKKVRKSLHKPCKLSCLLIAIFIVSILPMFITEILRYSCLTSSKYINTITIMTAISLVQTMIYPQVIFCVDIPINRAVHCCFVKTRRWITSQVFRQQQEVPTLDDMSDTEV